MKTMLNPERSRPRPLAGPSLAEYVRLVQAFPLIHIGDDGQLTSAMTMIDSLIDKPNRSPAEEAYLGALTDLVETYEDAHVVIPPRTGVDALCFLMEVNDLKQADLVPILGRRSLVSEIVNRKRGLALAHIRKLAAYFHVSPVTFIDDMPIPG